MKIIIENIRWTEGKKWAKKLNERSFYSMLAGEIDNRIIKIKGLKASIYIKK